MCGGIWLDPYTDCTVYDPVANDWIDGEVPSLLLPRGFADSVIVPNRGWWIMGEVCVCIGFFYLARMLNKLFC